MDIEKLLNDPNKIEAELAEFRESTMVLSADRPRMIEKYPKQWIALYDGEVRAAASTLNKVLDDVDRAGLPREHVIVRFVDKDMRTMVL